MKKPVVLITLGGLAGVLLTACADSSVPPTSPQFDLVLHGAQGVHAQSANSVDRWDARLTGGEEVPPRVTEAEGKTTLRLTGSDTELRYVLTVHRIENVVAAHIHLGARGVNGGIVVFLFGNAPPGGGPTSGLLAQGTITAANLIGALAGRSIADLVREIQAGNAYVNVHTNDGVDPVNTGPGDFPGGEIRGQLGPHNEK